MSKRQAPLVRAGSGDSHEARLAVLEQRFSDEMQARCSWCNKVASAKQGEWLEVIISTPGTGVRPAHVFRCLGCEAAPLVVSGGMVAVPSGARRPGASPPPLPEPSPAMPAEPLSGRAPRAARSTKSQARSPQSRQKKEKRGAAEGRNRPGTTGGEDFPQTASGPRRKRPQGPAFPGTLSPAP